MQFSLSPEQRAFRADVRRFLDTHWRPSPGGFGDEHDADFYAELARNGFIGFHWPREYGGQGRGGPVELAIFYEEGAYRGAPLTRYNGSVVFVGQSILTYGNEQQRQLLLPRIARGDALCCLCLTEPESGSDAAAAQTLAVEVADGFEVSGRKVFISGADVADFGLVMVRTDRMAPKHKGLSVLLIPLRSSGVIVRPMQTIAGWHVNQVTFDRVRVSRDSLVGPLNGGWQCIVRTLGFERSAMRVVGGLLRVADQLLERVPSNSRGMVFVRELALLRSDLQAARLQAYRIAWLQSQDREAQREASCLKLLVSELVYRMASLGTDVLGRTCIGVGGDDLLPTAIESLYRTSQYFITGGGTNEIQRNIIAIQGLGLPNA